MIQSTFTAFLALLIVACIGAIASEDLKPSKASEAQQQSQTELAQQQTQQQQQRLQLQQQQQQHALQNNNNIPSQAAASPVINQHLISENVQKYETASKDSPNSIDANEQSISVVTRGRPQFVGKRRLQARAQRPVFVGRRLAIGGGRGGRSSSGINSQATAIHGAFGQFTDNVHRLAKREATHSVEKRSPRYQARNAPWFVGKRAMSATDFDEDDEDEPDSINEVGMDFYSKRGRPRFIGKRYFDDALGAEKRARPRFIGKRIPMRSVMDFIDEAAYEQFDDDDDDIGVDGDDGYLSYLSKRGRPRFVGKRSYTSGQELMGNIDQVYKRGRPRFVGKRGAEQSSVEDMDKRARPRFIGKRSEDLSPIYNKMSKRGRPRFIGKREDDDENVFGYDDKRARPRFIGKKDDESTDFGEAMEKRYRPRFVGKRDSASNINEEVMKRGRPRFIGKRGQGTHILDILNRLNQQSEYDRLSNMIAKSKRTDAPRFIGKRLTDKSEEGEGVEGGDRGDELLSLR